MSTVEGGRNIVTQGLIYYIDAANRSSYSGSGVAWNDLTSGCHGTLTNGPTFSTSNGGSIVLDGVNDSVNILGGTFNYRPGINGELTLETWIYPTGPYSSYVVAPPTTNLACIFGQSFFNLAIGWGLGINVMSGVNNFVLQVRNSNTIVGITRPFNNNNWYHLVGTFTRNDFARLYINGILDGSTDSTSLNGLSLTPNNNDAALGNGGAGSFRYGGRIASAKIYSRPLSQQEVLQNFNATRARFGI